MSQQAPKTSVIYCGDCLDELKRLPDGSIDLVYLDPPFNSNRNYEVFWGDTRERRAFEDRFGDAQAYCEYMFPRIAELYRVLKKTGSLYYHCDWHASHYIKVKILDEIFGFNNFQTEITWRRTSAHGDTKGFGNITDSVFFYAKSKGFTWNPVFAPYDQTHVDKSYRNIEEQTGRRYSLADLTGAGIRKGETGKPWKGINPTDWNRHWVRPPKELEELDKEGLVHWPGKGKMPRLKKYLDEKGQPVGNIWVDISPVASQSRERLGYPTQKPLALLERIITASSNDGDIVLDPFCKAQQQRAGDLVRPPHGRDVGHECPRAVGLPGDGCAAGARLRLETRPRLHDGEPADYRRTIARAAAVGVPGMVRHRAVAGDTGKHFRCLANDERRYGD